MRYQNRSNPKSVPVRKLLSHIRKFDRVQFLKGLAVYAQQRYEREIVWGKFTGDEPWLVAGVAALVASRGYPSGHVPTFADIRTACELFFHLERPHEPDHPLGLERLIVPEMYRQGPYQRWTLGEMARPKLLFENLSWASASPPKIMTTNWDRRVLGCAVAEFLSAGFVLYATAMSGARYPLQDGGAEEVVYRTFGSKERFQEIVEALYVVTLDDFRDERRVAVEALKAVYDRPWVAEPFAFNPLARRPLIRGVVDGAAIAPAPEEIARRASVEGIVYEGLARHGSAFTADVGYYFEGYVGRQLRQIDGAKVHGEVMLSSRNGQRATVDWLVELPGGLLLVECKSALPRRDVVEGWETFREGHAQVLKGRRQITETYRAIRDRKPELAFLSNEKPVVGLVVTLGSYYAANELSLIGEPIQEEVPVGVVDAEFIEGLVTMSADDLTVFTHRMLSKKSGQHLEPRDLCSGLTMKRNDLLEGAFDSLPLLKQVGEERSRRTRS